MEFVNENITEINAKLKSLLGKLKNASKSDYAALMNQTAEEICMNCRFLSVIRLSQEPELGANGIASMKEGTKIAFAMLDDGVGNKYYPVFTDGEEFAKWQPMAQTNPRTMTLGFDNYAEMVLNEKNGAAGFVINPFSDNLLIKKEAVKKWYESKQHRTKGYAESRLSTSDKIGFSDYEAIPLQLVSALREAAEKNGGVSEMWLRLMTINGKKYHCVICSFTGDRMEVSNALGNAAKSYLEGMDLNVLSAADPTGKEAIKGADPIYKK